MRIGVMGSASDIQCQAVAREVTGLGATPVFVEADALELGWAMTMTDRGVFYRGDDLSDIRAWYMRSVDMPNVPTFRDPEGVKLYDDWYVLYMQGRERLYFFLSWLLQMHDDGALIANPPHAGSVLQLKPFQLHALRKLGAQTPRTLISNDPEAIRAFRREVRDVIYKPLMGGALTRTLDDTQDAHLELVRASPVIFQERAPGRDLRIMVVGDRVVSSVAIRTPEQHLDFRGDPAYSGGDAMYDEVELPPHIQEICVRATRACGLAFAGIDIKHEGDAWVFLELNSSPIYLDVERKNGHPISRAIAQMLITGR